MTDTPAQPRLLTVAAGDFRVCVWDARTQRHRMAKINRLIAHGLVRAWLPEAVALARRVELPAFRAHDEPDALGYPLREVGYVGGYPVSYKGKRTVYTQYLMGAGWLDAYDLQGDDPIVVEWMA